MRGISKAPFAVAAVFVIAVAGYSTSLMAALSLSNGGLHPGAPRGVPALAAGSSTQDLPDGPGKEVVERLCSGCHDLTFTISTRETEAGWTKIVNDMRSRGADGTEEEFAQVIAYLTAHMGKPEARQ